MSITVMRKRRWVWGIVALLMGIGLLGVAVMGIAQAHILGTVHSHVALERAAVEPALIVPGATIQALYSQKVTSTVTTLTREYQRDTYRFAVHAQLTDILAYYQRTLPQNGWRYVCTPHPVTTSRANAIGGECMVYGGPFGEQFGAYAVYEQADRYRHLNVLMHPQWNGDVIVEIVIITVHGIQIQDTFR